MRLRAPLLVLASATFSASAWAQEAPQRAQVEPRPPPPPQSAPTSAGGQGAPPEGTPSAQQAPPAGGPETGYGQQPGYGQPPGYGSPPGSAPPGYGYPQQPPPTSAPPPRLERVGPHDGSLEKEKDDGPRPFVTVTTGIFYFQFFGVGLGATIGAHLLPNTVLELDGYRATSIAPNQRSDSFAVRVQQIFADNFYVRGGVRLRAVEQTDVLDFDDYEDQTEQRDIGLDFAGGLRWSPGYLVLGADIAGIYMPVSAFDSEQQTIDTTNGEVLAADPRDIRLLVDVRLGYLYLGARF